MPIGLVVATTRATCVDGRETVGLQRGEGDRCHYWAKGTGFGTGSTTQSWDVEQALVRQRVEEEHVVWLVRLLAKYINPGVLLRLSGGNQVLQGRACVVLYLWRHVLTQWHVLVLLSSGGFGPPQAPEASLAKCPYCH